MKVNKIIFGLFGLIVILAAIKDCTSTSTTNSSTTHRRKFLLQKKFYRKPPKFKPTSIPNVSHIAETVFDSTELAFIDFPKLIDEVGYYKVDDEYKYQPFFKNVQHVVGGHDLKVSFGISKQNSQILFIIFRGTDNFTNFISDLIFWPVTVHNHTCKQCKIHKGFYDAYNSIKTELHEKIIDLIENNKFENELSHQISHIIIGGHSLGGALANISAFHIADIIKNQKYINISVLTFGAPRLGNKEFCGSLSNKIFSNTRVVFKKDPIPLIAPSDYLHCGNLIKFNTENSYDIYYPEESITKLNLVPHIKDIFINPSIETLLFRIFDHSKYFNISNKELYEAIIKSFEIRNPKYKFITSKQATSHQGDDGNVNYK